MENTLIGVGIAFMAGALIGGGLSAFGVTLPLISSLKRQILLFLLGTGVLLGGLYPTLREWLTEPPEPVMQPLEEGVNRAGYDFDHMGVDAANAYDCAELCRTNDQCVAMTYVVSRRTCWLKKAVPDPKPQPDHVSALKYTP